MNIPEIVKFHKDYKHINTVDHVILYYLSLEPTTVTNMYQLVYKTHAVVTRFYINKRLVMLERNGFVVGEYWNPSADEVYMITRKGINILNWLDKYYEFEKKLVGNVT